MKKIIYLINSFDTGGAEKAMVRLCSNLDKKKYKIECIALQKGDGSLIKGLDKNKIEYSYFRISTKFNILTRLNEIKKLKNYLRKKREAILICSLFKATFIGRVLGKTVSMRKIINWQHNTHDLNRITKRFLLNLTNPISDFIIADSKTVYDEYRKKICLLDSKKLVVVPIAGIELRRYYKKKSTTKKTIICSVGRLTKEKGYNRIIPIAKEIVKKYPNAIFKIAGEGNQRHYLEKQIKENNIQDKFILLGFVRDIPNFLAEADIYIQPSRWEGQCITVVEAMASYLPIVANNVGGIRESMQNGKNGFLIPKNNPEEYLEKIEILIKDKKLREKLGKTSRKIAEDKYDIKLMVKRFERLLK